VNKIFLKVYTDVVERWKDNNLMREYCYHYVLNNKTCGTKTVEESTRKNIIKNIHDIEQKINNSGDFSGGTIKDGITQLGRYIFKFILSEECRRELFDKKNLGKDLIIENMDSLIPIEIAFDGVNFLSVLYAMGRSVPVHNQHVSKNSQEINMYILSDPTEDLPYAHREAQKIIDLINEINSISGLSINVKYYNGKEITKELVLFDILFNASCDILHFIGHCSLDDKNGSHTSLLLSDGSLMAYELENMNGNPLIFCNSCSTAMNSEKKIFIGRGIPEGLAYNFVKYGAISCIASIWPISDDQAMEFASVFYREVLLEKKTIGEALRLAKVEINDCEIYNYLGVSYLLYGDPSRNLFYSNRDYLFAAPFYNEKAIYEIMRLEREYCGSELLAVNEHPWMFWNKITILNWVNKFIQSEPERDKMVYEFDKHKTLMREMCRNGQKHYKIILNLYAFEEYLREFEPHDVEAIILDIVSFLGIDSFDLVLYNGHEELEEYEIISKNPNENLNINDNVCIMIKQSRRENTEHYYYNLYFNDNIEFVKDYMSKHYKYKNSCLKYYKEYINKNLPPDVEKISEVSEMQVVDITRKILLNLLKKNDDNFGEVTS